MKKMRLLWFTALTFAFAVLLGSASLPHTAAVSIIEPGFPVTITPTGGGEPSGPGMNVLTANIDADPALEIVLPIQSGGPLGAWNADGSPVSGWPVASPNMMGMSAAGNLNQTLPGMEVVTLYSLSYNTSSQVYAYSTFGDVLPGFPITLPSPITTAPMLADVDGNGLDEIFLGAKNGKVYAYDATGASLAGWPLTLPGENAGTPIIVDLNDNDDLEMVVTYSDPGQLPTGYLTVLRLSDQTPLAGFPVSFRRDQFTTPFPVVGDVDGDGQLEIVLGVENTPTFYPLIVVYSRTGVLEAQMAHPELFIQSSSPPVLADLNGDSIPEILAQSRRGVSVWYGDGTPFPGWPVQSYELHTNMTPVVGDVTGDNVPEIIIATQSYTCDWGQLTIFDRNGQVLPNLSLGFPTGRGGVPAIADIDLDGRNEIILTSSAHLCSHPLTEPKVWVFDLGGTNSSGAIQWGQFNNGPRHPGVYNPPPTHVDLAVSITDNPDPVIATSPTAYTVAVTNLGSGMARNVRVNDTLPAGSTLVGVTPSQGTCTTASGVVTCNLGDMFNGATATVTLNVSYPQAGTMTNTASVATDSSESTLGNNVASQSTTVLPGANLALTMTSDRQRYTEGSTVVYSLTLNNSGPDAANNVAVTDRLPSTFTYVSSAPSQGNYNPISGVWTVGTLANGQGATLTITATVNANVGSIPIDNTAQVTNLEPADPNLANNSATTRINVDIADLSVALDLDNFTPLENTNVTYTVTVRNNGTGLATGVSVSAALPSDLSYISSTPGQGTYNSATGVWTIGTVNASQTVSMTLVAHVNSGTSGQVITHQVSIISSDQVDRVSYNNQQSVEIYVNGVQLHVNGNLNVSSGTEGSAVTFTVTVTNYSLNTATGIVVAVPVPSGATFSSATPSQGSYDSASGEWQLDTLTSGAFETLALTVTVNAGTGGQVLVFTSTISHIDQPDFYTDNNTVTRQFTVMSANLRITMTVNNAVPKEGNSISFTITVTNLGPYSVTGVEASDLLPPGLTYASANPTRGTYSQASGVWTIGNLIATQSATLTLGATVNSGTSGTLISNTAQITASSLPDHVSSNDSATVVVAVGGVDVSLLLSVDKTSPGEGENIVYTITADTVGNDPATNVVVEDILPAGLTYVSSTASAGSYDSGTGHWTIPTIPDIGTVLLQITASVNSGTTGTTITNLVTIVSADQNDPITSNNTPSVSVNVGRADLALTMTVDDTTPDPGANVTYTLTVANNATFAVTGIAVTDVLPSGLTFVSASGSYDPQTGIWTIGTLNGGASATLNLTAAVGSTLCDVRIDNTATISASNNPDSNSGNNSRMVSVTTNKVDLSISIGESFDAVYMNGSFSYMITVANTGSMAATGVVVTATLPSEVTLVSATATQGSGCTSSSFLTCNLGTIVAGGSAQITINLTANTGFTGRISITASVSADQPEANTANNSDTESTGITTLIVNSVNDVDDTVCSAAHCSLREAILAANILPGLDTIRFNLAGQGPYTIEPTSLLPVITSPVVLDGFSEPDYRGVPLIVLSGNNLSYTNDNNHGLNISAGGSTIRGFVIHRWGGDGIHITTNGNNVIQGNYIGTKVDAMNGHGNHQNGIYLGAPNNLIGGLSIAERNVIGGNNYWAIYANAPGNTIQGNYIGIKVDGSGGITNFGGGVNLANDNNIFGGTQPGARNVVASVQTNPAVLVWGANNVVQGNFIGTNPSGTEDFGNEDDGIEVHGLNNLIGGTEPRAGNVIAGSANGIHLINAMNTIVQGNLIGTDWTGTQPLGNSRGIYIEASNNLIGGTVPGARNVIADNGNDGIYITGNSNTVQGNYIGTDASGTEILGNRANGIRIDGEANLIGGTTPEARNVISGNWQAGIWLHSYRVRDTLIQGNYIGTDVTGMNPLGNGVHGIRVASGSDQNPFGNPNFIGGTAPGAGNRIAYNTGDGIRGDSYYAAASFLSNEIFGNSGLGINLGPGGVTPNDAGDTDNIWANSLQNYPVITSAVYDGSTLTVSGTLDSTINSDFRVEFFSSQVCDSSGYGEGQRYIGATTVTLGDSPASFTATFSNESLIGQHITATATYANSQTSEFSACAVLDGADLAFTLLSSRQTANQGDEVAFTLTVTNNGPDEATGIQVQAQLPAGLTYQSDNGAGSYTPGIGEWAVGTLAKDTSATLTISAIVNSGTTGSTITFPANIAAVNEVDLNPNNNQASTVISIGIADLDLLSELDSIAPNEGDTVTYYTIVANLGPSDATGIVISSPLPAGVTYVSELLTQGSYDETTGEWLVGSLTSGDEASLSVTVTVNSGTQGSTLDNTAAITAADQFDPITANNTDGKSVQVGFADVGLQSLVDNSAPGTGEQVNLTIIVSNNGPSDATDVVIESPLPAGLTLDSATTTTGNYNMNEGRWTVMGLSRGNQAVLTLAGTVSSGTGGSTLSTTSQVIERDQIDLNAANDSASVQINVLPEVDLAIATTANPSSAPASEVVTLTVTITNNGQTTADDVTVQDVLPTALEFVSASADHGLYDHSIGVWSVGSLAASQIATLTIETSIKAGTPVGTISNTATILSASLADPNAANNSATASVTVEAIPTVPVLALPANGSSTSSRQPTFTWNSVLGAISYELRLGINNPPTSIAFTGSATSYTPAAPLLTTTYYWQVRSLNADSNYSAWSEPRTIIIVSAASAAPGRNLYMTATPTLSWGRVSWATGYEIEIDNNSNFSSPEYRSGLLSSSTLSHTPMTPLPDGTWYWRARARRADGTWGTWSTPDSFVVDVS